VTVTTELAEVSVKLMFADTCLGNLKLTPEEKCYFCCFLGRMACSRKGLAI